MDVTTEEMREGRRGVSCSSDSELQNVIALDSQNWIFLEVANVVPIITNSSCVSFWQLQKDTQGNLFCLALNHMIYSVMLAISRTVPLHFDRSKSKLSISVLHLVDRLTRLC